MTVEVEWIGWSECIVCYQPLRDADSIERGYGKWCVEAGQRQRMSEEEQRARKRVAAKIRRRFPKRAQLPDQSFEVARLTDGAMIPISKASKRDLISRLLEEFPIVEKIKDARELGRMDKRKIACLFRELRMLNNTRPVERRVVQAKTKSGLAAQATDIDPVDEEPPVPEEFLNLIKVAGWKGKSWIQAAKAEPEALAKYPFKGGKSKTRDDVLDYVGYVYASEEPASDPPPSKAAPESKVELNCIHCGSTRKVKQWSTHASCARCVEECGNVLERGDDGELIIPWRDEDGEWHLPGETSGGASSGGEATSLSGAVAPSTDVSYYETARLEPSVYDLIGCPP